MFVDNGEIFRKCHHVSMLAERPYSPITALNAALFRLFKRFYFLEFGGGGAGFKKIMILDIPLPNCCKILKYVVASPLF